MMRIDCCDCGPRDAGEFVYLGVVKQRPDPNTTLPVEWRAYLYQRANARGWCQEHWLHRAGCGQVLLVERDTANNEIRRVARVGNPQGEP